MTSVTGGHNMILRFLFRHYKRILWTGQVCGILFCVRKIEISGESFQYVPKVPPRLFTIYYIQGCGFYITDNYNKNKGEYAENLLKFTVGYAILLHTAYISFMRISICGEGRYEIQRTYIAA